MGGLRRLLPVNTPIFRRAAANISGLSLVLRLLDKIIALDPRQRAFQQLFRRLAHLVMQRQRIVFRGNYHFLLGNNRTGIGAFHHAVQRHAGFLFAVDQHPV